MLRSFICITLLPICLHVLSASTPDAATKSSIVKAVLSRPVPKNLYLKYTLTQTSDTVPKKAGIYEIYRDAERYYLQGDLALETAEKRVGTVRDTMILSWNGKRYQSMDIGSQSGRIKGQDTPSAFRVIPDAILGKMRWDETLSDVISTASMDKLEIEQVNDHLVSIRNEVNPKQSYKYVFDQKLGYAIVSIALHPTNPASPDQGREITFSDFQSVDGYFIPRHGELHTYNKAAESVIGKNAVMRFDVEVARVNQPDIDERLKGFNFPKGTKIWDEVLNRSIE